MFGIRTVYRNFHTKRGFGVYRVGRYVSAGLCLVGGVSVFSYVSNTSDLTPSLSAAKSATLDQTAKPTRMVLWYFKQLFTQFISHNRQQNKNTKSK